MNQLQRIKDDIHAFIDPYWKSGMVSRGYLYKELTDNTSMSDFHCSLLPDQHTALLVYKEVIDYLLTKYNFIQTKDFEHKRRYIFTHEGVRKIGTFDKRYKGFFIGGDETFLNCEVGIRLKDASYCVRTSIKSKRAPVGLRKIFIHGDHND